MVKETKVYCYDRKTDFYWLAENLDKKSLLIFYNSEKNGMSTFLEQVYEDYDNVVKINYFRAIGLKKQFENKFDEILKLLEKEKNDKESLINIIKKIFEGIGCLLKTTNPLISFFVNLSSTAIKKYIEKKSIFDLESILAKALGENSIVIIDDADRMVDEDINFIRALFSWNDSIKFILALKSETLDIVINKLKRGLPSFEEREFKYPKDDDDIRTILDGLKQDGEKIEYHGVNFRDFTNMRDLLARVKKQVALSDSERLVYSFLYYLKCPIELENISTIFNKYGQRNLNSYGDVEPILRNLIFNGLISVSGSVVSKLNHDNFAPKLKDEMICKAISAYFLDNAENFDGFNEEFLESIYLKFNSLHGFLSNINQVLNKLRLSLLKKTSSYEIFKSCLSTEINIHFINDYKVMIVKAYNFGLYRLFRNLKLDPLIKKSFSKQYLIIDLLFKERQQLNVNGKILEEEIIKNKELNSNYSALLLIYLFTINLNKKNRSKQAHNILFNKSSPLYYENYKNSDYYHILGNIMACYLEDYETCKALFKNSLNMESKDSIFHYRLLNNYFVFLILRYEMNPTPTLQEEIEKLLHPIIDVIFNADYNFLAHNYCVFKILTDKPVEEDEFLAYRDRCITKSHEQSSIENLCLYNILRNRKNKKSSEIDISDYILLESEINKSSIEVTKLIYWQNTYILAKITENTELMEKSKKYLMESKDYKYASYRDRFDNALKTDASTIRERLKYFLYFGHLLYRQPDFELFIRSLDC
ncbi:MAG: hypothetical protein LBI42_07590 [Chitinispirillales bacterium]|jgi:hypothetical protein|nr:hypothetical protein [Chitinispirillales bacterium]